VKLGAPFPHPMKIGRIKDGTCDDVSENAYGRAGELPLSFFFDLQIMTWPGVPAMKLPRMSPAYATRVGLASCRTRAADFIKYDPSIPGNFDRDCGKPGRAAQISQDLRFPKDTAV